MPSDKKCDIELRNVSKVIDGETIIDDISWGVGEGENWALIGANGAGKTTLMEIITGYMWPSEGQVRVLGHDFGDVDLRELRKRIGYVNSVLLSEVPPMDTVREIVLSGKFGTLGLYDETSARDLDRAEEMLEVMGCADRSGERFETLSQGEKQKTIIARSLMPDPDLLILDEPAMGLDPASRESFLERIEKIAMMENGPTMIYITHHIEEIIPVFARVIVLKGGSVLTSGERSEVLTGEILSEAFDRDMDVIEKEGRYVLA